MDGSSENLWEILFNRNVLMAVVVMVGVEGSKAEEYANKMTLIGIR